MEHGIDTPASLCGYTGVVLCLACTQKFYDPVMKDRHNAPGRVMLVRPELNEFPNFSDDGISFDEDYVPKPFLDPEKLHE